MKAWRASRPTLLSRPTDFVVAAPALPRDRPTLSLYPTAKRALDIVLASAVLALFSPLLLAAIVAIAVSSPGPVLFGHARCGRGGGTITCWKLRTMKDGADSLITQNERLAEEWELHRKLHDDPRVTRVGKVLRASSLDELPQLVNVIRGEMSLVGPRPVPKRELDEKYGESATEVLSVLPGITGLWQVSGRSCLSYDERVQLDLEYIRSRSIKTDVAILMRTPGAVLSRRGAV